MRRVIGGAFISVDGVIQAPGGPEEDRSGGFRFGGWSQPHFDQTLGGFLGEVFGESEYDLLLAGTLTKSSPPTGRTRRTTRSARSSTASASTW